MKTVLMSCIAALVLVFNACTAHEQKAKLAVRDENDNQAYRDLLKQERARTEQIDSIFYGIYLKMSAAEFYAHCSDMYRKGIFDGGYDMQVVVHLAAPFRRPVKLSFYPSFDKPFIARLKCHFSYAHANIFNKADRSGVLIKEVVPFLLARHGGNEFIRVPSQNPVKGPEYIKIDANRKIHVSESDNGTDVEVVYEDLKPLR